MMRQLRRSNSGRCRFIKLNAGCHFVSDNDPNSGQRSEDMSVPGARPDIPGQVSRASFSFFGAADGVDVMHFNSVANATLQYNKLVNNTASQSTRSETPNYWGLSYYTAAAGHAQLSSKHKRIT